MLLNEINNLKVDKEQKDEFRRYKFNQNILRISIACVVLILEQLVFGLLISEPGSPIMKVHLVTASCLAVIGLAAVYFIRNKPAKICLWHEIYETCFTLFGMTVALMRFVILNEGSYNLPTIYIAVLYGAAVVFIYRLWQGILCYFLFSLAAVILFPLFHHEAIGTGITADIISNGIIAWGIVLLNYRTFIHSFQHMQEIERKNIELIENNREIEKINITLREQSIHDELTGLYNRRKLNEVCQEVYLKAERYSLDFSLILMDIDFFKQVNDTYGHDIGDKVLKEFSLLLKANVRDVDVCGRWGGEEFLVICQETDLKNAELLAERLRKTVEMLFFNGNLKITASFGVAEHLKGSSLHSVIKDADIRLYEAKHSGRNRVVCSL